jgi:hypothetical protein
MKFKYDSMVDSSPYALNVEKGGERGFIITVNPIDYFYSSIFKEIQTEVLFKVVGYLICYLLTCFVCAKILKAKDIADVLKRVYEIKKPEAHHTPSYSVEVVREADDDD